MSQKINPVSIKTGVIKTWNYKSLKYGRSFKNYTKLIQSQKYIFSYLNRLFINYNLLIENVGINQMILKTFINVVSVSPKKLESFKEKKQILNTVSYWTNASVILSFYKSNSFVNTSSLISNYVIYLFLQKSMSPKKILQLLYKALKNQEKSKQIRYTINGIKMTKLKGFKIEISGCFESSRSQMSKLIKCNFGTIPSTKLNGYVDYSTNTIFTKFGSCGFKVWLFYEFI